MHVVMTGATGFIGSALCAFLQSQGCDISVLTRDEKRAQRLLGKSVLPFTQWADAPMSADAFINLAGAPLFGQRWSTANKDRMRASRMATTHGMVNVLPHMFVRPEVVINASAIGYYGYSDDGSFVESDAAGSDFGAHLCRDWEAAADGVKQYDVRLCRLRFGVVLDSHGGALKRMLPAYRLGLGGPLGSGKQWLSWIHINDLLALIWRLLNDRSQQGAFNACAPQPVQNAAFSHALAKTLHRPEALRMPAFVLRGLFGEGADLLLKGQRVLPQRTLESGFEFQFPDIDSALHDLLAAR